MNTSVFRVASSPSIGWICVNPVVGTTPSHAASPTIIPSRFGSSASFVAVATGRGRSAGGVFDWARTLETRTVSPTATIPRTRLLLPYGGLFLAQSSHFMPQKGASLWQCKRNVGASLLALGVSRVARLDHNILSAFDHINGRRCHPGIRHHVLPKQLPGSSIVSSHFLIEQGCADEQQAACG